MVEWWNDGMMGWCIRRLLVSCFYWQAQVDYTELAHTGPLGMPANPVPRHAVPSLACSEALRKCKNANS